MASCSTSQWVSTSPYITLTVTQSSETATTAILSWILKYNADYAASTSTARSYTVKINGSTVKEGTYSINGKTGTSEIASGTKTINKTTSTQNISFSCSMAFNLTWSGVYGGTKSASGSISVSKKTSYTITYNANGGTGAPAKQTKWHGTNLTLSSTKPTRTGYTFIGWNTSSTATTASYSAGGSYTSNANATLYAVWKALTYTVSYNANGGTGIPDSQTKTYGVTLKLSPTKPTRTNYTFLGWSTSSTATTASYSAGGNYTANSSVTLYAVWSLAYKKPRINNISIYRSNNSGTSDENGTYIRVKFKATCDYTISEIIVSWKKSGDSSYTSVVTNSITSTSYEYDSTIGEGNIDVDTTYNLQIKVTDSNNGYTVLTRNIGGSTKYLLDFKAGGKGISMFKAAELDNVLDMGNNIVFRNNKEIQGENTDGSMFSTFIPMNTNGNTVIGYDHYSKKSGNTNIYGNNITIGVSDVASGGTTYKPYYSQGDEISIVFRTAGYITNAKKDLSFWVPLSKPIIGSPTVTATSVSGFVLRQGDSYTHGSGANTFITPTSYEVSATYGTGIYVKATFSDVTNAINNDTIGVYWSGKIILS